MLVGISKEREKEWIQTELGTLELITSYPDNLLRISIVETFNFSR